MKNLVLLLLMFSSLSVFSQQVDCEKYKDGKFIIVDEENGNSHIERKGSKQTEYGEGSGLKLEFKIKWLNECTYTVTLKKIVENPNKIPLSKDMVLTVEIIETKENSYMQRSTSNLYDMVIESEMMRVD